MSAATERLDTICVHLAADLVHRRHLPLWNKHCSSCWMASWIRPYKANLDAIRTRKIAADGMSWIPFVSPQRDFRMQVPIAGRTSVRNNQFMVAPALGVGHMYGMIRHPRLWKIESEECRQAVFTFLEVSGGKVTRWNLEGYAGRRCLHTRVRGSDGGETKVLVILQPENIYLVAAVRRARFLRSFRLLTKKLTSCEPDLDHNEMPRLRLSYET